MFDQSLMTALPSDEAGCCKRETILQMNGVESIQTYVFPSFTHGFSNSFRY